MNVGCMLQLAGYCWCADLLACKCFMIPIKWLNYCVQTMAVVCKYWLNGVFQFICIQIYTELRCTYVHIYIDIDVYKQTFVCNVVLAIFRSSIATQLSFTQLSVCVCEYACMYECMCACIYVCFYMGSFMHTFLCIIYLIIVHISQLSSCLSACSVLSWLAMRACCSSIACAKWSTLFHTFQPSTIPAVHLIDDLFILMWNISSHH